MGIVRNTAKKTKHTANAQRHRRRHKRASFKTYIYRVLKQVHPTIGMSSKAMSVMNSFVYDMFDRISRESATLVRKAKRSTIETTDVVTALQLVVRGELGKHAKNEARKAVVTYVRNKK